MKMRIGGLTVLMLTLGFLAGCSGSTPGFMTPTKPRSASDDPTVDPFERVGNQLKEKQSSSSPPVTAPAAAAPAPQPAAAEPATKAAQ